ncbi:MAG: hypothetical protein HC933_02795 [Pleurocapsa sp. SU_196_0]|nr:hypothetical protein [Pleurocapsa sp. SU_196_0]
MIRVWRALPALLALLCGCIPGPGTSFIGPVEVTVSKSEVAVGESLTLTARFQDLPPGSRASELYLNAIPHAYLYSSSDFTEGPYHPDPQGGLLPSGDPNLFPVDAAVEIQTPLTGADNVPLLQPASRLDGVLTSTFVLKGRSVGKANLRVAFILESKREGQPSGWTRIPLFPSGAGLVVIAVK